ncbi:MAG: VOC family protein [Nocardioidaceae bacterium]
MSPPVRWMSAFLDNPRDRARELESFWSAVVGHPVSSRQGDHGEFAALEPPDGDPHLWFQDVDGPAALHPDLDVDDVESAARDAALLGAHVMHGGVDRVALSSPGGQPFCVVRHRGSVVRPAPARWPGGASIADQICLDIPSQGFEQEAVFWTSLTGWTRSHGQRREFDDLLPGPEMAMHLLLQRIDEPNGPTRAHLDLACDDRDSETERHRALGADLVRRTQGWTTLRDPAGRVYCLTDRPAGVDKTLDGG